MSDPFANNATTPLSFGTVGKIGVPDNDNDIDPVAKAIHVTGAGTTLKVLPVGNADGAWITIGPVAVGYCPPWRIRRVHTDTDCTYAEVTG